MDAKTKTIEDIARRLLGIETLETRSSDAFDFYDLAIWSIRKALEAAHDAGGPARPERTAR
jgi:hypothetical protein